MSITDTPPDTEPATKPHTATLRFDQVTKRYDRDTTALADINFTVTPGEFVFLVGQSGSGKSTLLRLITREETPTSGTISVGSKDLASLRGWNIPSLRRTVGCIFQDYKLLPNRTVYDNVAFALRVTGRKKEIARQVPAILKLVGLADKTGRYPDQLSGGEQQRVSIARAFVNRPSVLLADEPTGNLDPATGEDIMSLLARINQIGTTVVMATHDAGIVNLMRRRVIHLEHGHLVRDEHNATYQPETLP